MLVHVDLGVVFLLVCIVQGSTTAAYLLLAPPRTAARRWLGLWLLALTLQVVDYALSRSGVYFRHHALYFAPLFFSWGYGPLLYAAVRAWAGAVRPIRRWHFAPVAVQAAFYALLFLQPLTAKTTFWIDVHKPITRWIEYYLSIASVGVYVWMSMRTVRSHPGSPPRLHAMLAALAGFYAVAAVDPLVNASYLPAGAPRFWLQSLLLPVIAYAVALHGLFAARLTTRPDDRPANAPPPAPRTAVAAHVSRIVHALERDALYRDAELTLDRLAAHVGLAPNAVSQAINAGLGQSFADVVNGYRLADVQRRLSGPDESRRSLLTIALDAGFNSKTTFNRVFKDRTGLTPREYRDRCRQASTDAGPADATLQRR
jgi:AraC-like DNA-binding protein